MRLTYTCCHGVLPSTLVAIAGKQLLTRVSPLHLCFWHYPQQLSLAGFLGRYGAMIELNSGWPVRLAFTQGTPLTAPSVSPDRWSRSDRRATSAAGFRGCHLARWLSRTTGRAEPCALSCYNDRLVLRQRARRWWRCVRWPSCSWVFYFTAPSRQRPRRRPTNCCIFPRRTW